MIGFKFIREVLENELNKRKELLEKFPPDVPNPKCLHAFIKGIKIESFKLSVGDFFQFRN
jgi:hypothetical protein